MSNNIEDGSSRAQIYNTPPRSRSDAEVGLRIVNRAASGSEDEGTIESQVGSTTRLRILINERLGQIDQTDLNIIRLLEKMFKHRF